MMTVLHGNTFFCLINDQILEYSKAQDYSNEISIILISNFQLKGASLLHIELLIQLPAKLLKPLL